MPGGLDQLDDKAKGGEEELHVASTVGLGRCGVSGGEASLGAQMFGGGGEIVYAVGDVVEDGAALCEGAGDGTCFAEGRYEFKAGCAVFSKSKLDGDAQACVVGDVCPTIHLQRGG